MSKVLSKAVREALESSGVEWELVTGKKHHKLLIRGRMVQVLPRGSRSCAPRGDANCLAAVRRALRAEA